MSPAVAIGVIHDVVTYSTPSAFRDPAEKISESVATATQQLTPHRHGGIRLLGSDNKHTDPVANGNDWVTASIAASYHRSV
jgi:hypothetical protein